MKESSFIAALFLLCGVFSVSYSLDTWPIFALTVTAKDRKVEVTYKNIQQNNGDSIILTSSEAKNCIYSGQWICDDGDTEVLYAFQPSDRDSYHKTDVIYEYTSGEEYNKNSKCDSVWAIYLNYNGKTVASTCLQLYPTWINDLLPKIGSKRFRDLLIPGTHDTGSYREAFGIPQIELPLTRYSLTQDDTILGQLYAGARYLDIRPAHYSALPYKWYVNHGITIQHPLKHVMEQVVEFVKETNEPVIFGLKEFPEGFKDRETHRKLVKYMVDYFGEYLLKPNSWNPWASNLNELLANPYQRVILAYDDWNIVSEFSDVLFPAVNQNWGNVRKWKDLEKYLKNVSMRDQQRLSDTPVADMAELTPTELDVIFDRLHGLRSMADSVNLPLSDLYEDELYPYANIISLDFFRGTRISQLAIYVNGL